MLQLSTCREISASVDSGHSSARSAKVQASESCACASGAARIPARVRMQTANPARIPFPIRRRANVISNFREGGGGSNVAYHKPRQKRKRRKRALAGDAGGELAEGVHCGGNLSGKECARIILSSRCFSARERYNLAIFAADVRGIQGGVGGVCGKTATRPARAGRQKNPRRRISGGGLAGEKGRQIAIQHPGIPGRSSGPTIKATRNLSPPPPSPPRTSPRRKTDSAPDGQTPNCSSASA